MATIRTLRLLMSFVQILPVCANFALHVNSQRSYLLGYIKVIYKINSISTKVSVSLYN